MPMFVFGELLFDAVRSRVSNRSDNPAFSESFKIFLQLQFSSRGNTP